MPKVEIEGGGSIEVPSGTRLVNAVSAAGVEIGHRCGGWAKCTTCRVEVRSGEPRKMTRAEHDKLAEGGLLGRVRLACQIAVEEDLTVKPLMLVGEQGWSDAGPEPEATITPDPEWVEEEG